MNDGTKKVLAGGAIQAAASPLQAKASGSKVGSAAVGAGTGAAEGAIAGGPIGAAVGAGVGALSGALGGGHKGGTVYQSTPAPTDHNDAKAQDHARMGKQYPGWGN